MQTIFCNSFQLVKSEYLFKYILLECLMARGEPHRTKTPNGETQTGSGEDDSDDEHENASLVRNNVEQSSELANKKIISAYTTTIT